MLSLEFSKDSPTRIRADAVVVFATKQDGDAHDGRVQLTGEAAALGKQLKLGLADELAAVGFHGGLGEVARLSTRGKARASRLLVVGLGEAESVTRETLRKAAGAASRDTAQEATLAVVVPGELPEGDTDGAAVVQAVVEGAGLGGYAYTEHRTATEGLPALESVFFLAGEGQRPATVKDGVASGRSVVRGVGLTRDLVNTPPFAKRPPDLADRIVETAKTAGLKSKVFDQKALEKGGFGGILGVGRGSSVEPRLVELTYDPPRARGHVVLVGKGITFDSGGLSLKTSEGMKTMKSDMGGAGAIVGAMSVLGDLGVRTKVTGLVALAENMPSGDAIRVSDVLTHYDRTTVEVMNTDAEGRLVLADALAYGAESKPDVMIDLATLTGAQIVSLGRQIAGLMGTDDELCTALESAGQASGEKLWRLPLPEEYADHLKSEVADLKNIGKGGEAGTVIAGMFLKNFIHDVPWAHLDIAGPAFSEEGDAYLTPKGGTGAGVRTLVRYLRDLG